MLFLSACAGTAQNAQQPFDLTQFDPCSLLDAQAVGDALETGVTAVTREEADPSRRGMPPPSVWCTFALEEGLSEPDPFFPGALPDRPPSVSVSVDAKQASPEEFRSALADMVADGRQTWLEGIGDVAALWVHSGEPSSVGVHGVVGRIGFVVRVRGAFGEPDFLADAATEIARRVATALSQVVLPLVSPTPEAARSAGT